MAQGGHCHGRVIMIRGLLDVFSLGMDDLAEKAAKAGFDAQVARQPDWRSLSAQEIDNHGNHNGIRPLIVGGHSYGADNAIRFCRRLQSRGIDVDLLLLLDATTPPLIPSNVERCVHFYRPSFIGDIAPFLFAGNPVEMEESNKRTKLFNIPITGELLGKGPGSVGHFNIDASPEIHNLCLNEMEQVYRQHRAQADAGSHGVAAGGGG